MIKHCALPLLFIYTLINSTVAKPIENLKIELGLNHLEKLENGFTALSISGVQEFGEIVVVVDAKEYKLHRNNHFDDKMVSNLLLFDNPKFEFELINKGGKTHQVLVTTYNGNYKPSVLSSIEVINSNKRNNCSLPPFIDQDVWREDLPNPKPNPSTTDVSHLVIHHSATTNNVNDYTLAVRNIYLYHVNNNGWDDVGYNYLIAPDGTLYAGRDGQGKDDDNIKGAHFCAKNSYTMGICLIGNYSEITPSDSMLVKLEALLAWKAKKEEIQPLEFDFHPKGSSTGFELATICGHRDGYKAGVFSGCQTECPGNFTYQVLDSIRLHVAERLVDCGFAVGKAEPGKDEVHFSNGMLHLSKQQKVGYQVFDLSGRTLFSGISNNNIIDLRRLPKGVFVVRLKTNNGLESFKIMNYGN